MTISDGPAAARPPPPRDAPIRSRDTFPGSSRPHSGDFGPFPPISSPDLSGNPPFLHLIG
ncbi:hypothetical protein [Burkholderia perseverans]|uniref:hypothetical protein n=1 Tax=Burkholderia perseverans TaxID=2615214 RepID=UPI001FEDF8E8|nr:hypothetical protein [Burkholderia perseverans]